MVASTRACGPCSLQGEGRTFCVGGDLKVFAGHGDDLPAHLTDVTTYFHAAISRLTRLDAPVVAAVQGSAAGGGFEPGAGGRPRPGRRVEPVRHRLHRDRAHPRRLAAPGRCPASSGCAGPSTSRSPTDGSAPRRRSPRASPPASWPTTQLADEALALARSLAAGPTGALGAAKRLLRDVVRAATSRRSWPSRPSRWRAAGGQRRQPRGHRRVPREAPARLPRRGAVVEPQPWPSRG